MTEYLFVEQQLTQSQYEALKKRSNPNFLFDNVCQKYYNVVIMKRSSTRTKEYLDKKGIRSGIVERFIGQINKKVDLFNIIDIIAIYPSGICGIQACGTDFAEHDRKILASTEAHDWLVVGGQLELWGWRKKKVKRGGKAVMWEPRIKRYDINDFI